ncbi:hypothetical protein TSOC_012321 [Tetrabaena socialis]|uniref:Uncharacterized protein n=1 Tax=Tetrabaena socialis TaxID=47790 RepID=A0A2J7ZNB6_9CHLO|nr:hypothetical protein TSOC_012321 [Tetrabaena socialis]|eukprot:PNH01763.1 hypothetical protein TSOC_012321 [Tetrabaena socialis]
MRSRAALDAIPDDALGKILPFVVDTHGHGSVMLGPVNKALWGGVSRCRSNVDTVMAVMRGNAGMVGMLLRAGAPVDRSSLYHIDNVFYTEYRTPLAVAGDPALLEAGASINGVRAPILLHGEPLNENHSYFTPPIVAAILSGKIEVVRQLVTAGAVIDSFPTFVNYHRLPLVAAAERGFRDIVELLLDLGAPPDGYNEPGAPLSLSSSRGEPMRKPVPIGSCRYVHYQKLSDQVSHSFILISLLKCKGAERLIRRWL